MNKKENQPLNQKKNSERPVLFEISTIAGLFFNNDGIDHLFKDDFLQLEEVLTIDKHRASIIIALYITTAEYFELRFVVTTTRGIERMSIYDNLENLESFQLKKWMHIALCDGRRKNNLINKHPEEYNFDPTHVLA